MPIPVILESFSWPSRSAAENSFRSILRDSGYELNEPIADPIHDQMLRQLVERHPDRNEKVGDGIEHFYVGLTRDGGRTYVSSSARGIWIKRTDGSSVDFSYRTAIHNHSHKSDVKEALRLAVEEARVAYRDSRFANEDTVCSDIGAEPFARRADAQVVYLIPSWSQLTHAFVQMEGGWNAIEVHSGDGATTIGAELRDAKVRMRWTAFHRAHANYGLATSHEAATRPRTDERAWNPHEND